MKHLFKSLAVLAFVFAVFACQDDSNEILDRSTSKHDNARTNYVYTDIYAGTSTLPAGTYDVLRIHNGANVTFANGVVWNNLNWTMYSSSGTPSTITIPSGASVNTYHTNTIPETVTVNNYGTVVNVYGTGHWTVDGTMNNYGNHQTWYLYIGGNYNNKSGGNVNGTLIEQKYFGKMNFSGCSFAQTVDLTTDYHTSFLQGRGYMKATGSVRVIGNQLTGSPYVKVCASNPISYETSGSQTGSFGSGIASCTSGCVDF